MTLQIRKAQVNHYFKMARAFDPELFIRLFANINIAGAGKCWEWKRTVKKSCYPYIWYKGYRWRSHRLVYTMFYGEIPEKLMVLHECDNTSCCNPQHLHLGTALMNATERKERQREGNHKGIANGRAKLNQNKVNYILWSKEKNVALTKKFGVSKTVITRIKKNKSWKHLPQKETTT